MKWSFVPMTRRAAPGEPRPTRSGHRYLVVNADEKEPGTMKDRWLMEGNPHQLLEGALIAAWAVQADIAYIFLRREYTVCAQSLTRAIAEAQKAGYIGEQRAGHRVEHHRAHAPERGPLHVRRGKRPPERAGRQARQPRGTSRRSRR